MTDWLISVLIILGGDFNLPMDITIDRQPRSSLQPSRADKSLHKLCTRVGLYDAWRLQHTDTMDYTYFSNPHMSCSWIDYPLISKPHIQLIDQTDTLTRQISDHSAISLSFTGTNVTTPSKIRWINQEWIRDRCRYRYNRSSKEGIETTILNYLKDILI